MARKSVTNSAVVEAGVEQSTPVVLTEEKNMNIEKKEVNTEPLRDSDEIDVVSLVPNVSYKDSHTGDFLEWETIGHIEPMSFEMLKNMWKTNKGYFRNMCLKPLDDRVVKKFGLEGIFEKHEFLMDKTSYTRANIDRLRESISSIPNGMKFAVLCKVKSLVATGEISDIVVIKALEKHLNSDLTSFLN